MNSRKPKEEAEVSAVQESDCYMRKYRVALERVGISKAAFEEIHGFCVQYPEKKAKIADALSLNSPNLSGMPHGGNVSDPTAKAGETILKWTEDVELIEKTAKEIDEFFAPWIIKSVTEDIPVWSLILNYNMPATEKVFAKKRRQYYYLLALKKQII